jgi:hypothetical protein
VRAAGFEVKKEIQGYVATQLCDTESGEFDNPAVQPFIEKLRQHEELRSLLETGEQR